MQLDKKKKIKLTFIYALSILWIAVDCIGYTKDESKQTFFIIQIILALTFAVVHTIYTLKDISLFK